LTSGEVAYSAGMGKMGSDRRGVSAILGMLLVLAVVASALTVIAVYKIPVLKKRIEFEHEAGLLNEFFKLRKAYLTNYSATFELSPHAYLLKAHEDSCFSVFTSGREVLTYVANGSAHAVHGRIFGFNISVYPSRLPYVHASLTPLKTVVYQNGYNLTLLNSSEQFCESTFTLSGNDLRVVVYDFTVNGKRLSGYTVSGNGFCLISISKSERAVRINNVTSVDFTLTSSTNFVRKLNGNYNMTLVFCNYSIDVS